MCSTSLAGSVYFYRSASVTKNAIRASKEAEDNVEMPYVKGSQRDGFCASVELMFPSLVREQTSEYARW